MTKQLTLNDILKMFLSHIKLIVILAIVGAIVAFGFVKLFVDEMYTASALLLVQNDGSFSTDVSSAVSSDTENEKVNTKDITDSVMFTTVCQTLFTTDPDMTKLFAGCNVSISAIEESFFITVVVTSTDPDKAANVANQLTEQAPQVVEKYFEEKGKVDTVYSASIPGAPSSPDVKKFVVMGFLAGLVLALALSFLLEIVDTTIKANDDLYAMYDIPVFAEIVDFEVEGGAKKK